MHAPQTRSDLEHAAEPLEPAPRDLVERARCTVIEGRHERRAVPNREPHKAAGTHTGSESEWTEFRHARRLEPRDDAHVIQ